MAASVLQRFLTAPVKFKCIITPALTARRCLLSAVYRDTTLWESREKDPQNLALLATSMDRTYDKKLPVSSLTISRFVDNITSREEVDQAEYYLYKFRHSPNCWYLKDWTVHSWIKLCLKYGARDKALYTLKNKVQYGMFPDDFTFNLLIDSYIKDEDFKGACSVVEEVTLQEAFDLPSTQILSLYALSSYLATQSELTVAEERVLGAALLIAGLKQDNTVGFSAQLLGNSLLGKLEMTKGINAVFKGMPLTWTPGYLGRALDVMEGVAAKPGDIRLSQDPLDTLNDLLQELSSVSDVDSSIGEESGGVEDRQDEVKLDEDDVEERAKLPHYVSRFKELRGQLESENRVDPAPMQTLVSVLATQALATAEQLDLEQYQSRLQDWEVERRHLIQREKEMLHRAEGERQKRIAVRAAAHQQGSEVDITDRLVCSDYVID